MDQQQIKTFIDAMAASDLEEMEVSHDGWTLRLVRHARAGVAAASPSVIPARPSVFPAPSSVIPASLPVIPAKAGTQGVQDESVTAPMFGVVHLQQAPGEPPFVKPGDVIEAGQMLCTIEAMKVFNEVRAERAGRVAAVLVTSGTEVEAGQPLFTIGQAANV